MSKRIIATFFAVLMLLGLSTSIAAAAAYGYGNTTLGATQPSSYRVYPNARKKTSTISYITNTNEYARRTSDEVGVKYYTGAWDALTSNTRASASVTRNSGSTAKPALYANYCQAEVQLQLEVGNPNAVEIEVKGTWTPN